MEIEYLKKLEKNKKIGSETIKGVSDIEVANVEKKFKCKFPKSYKEYLYLAGKYAGNLPIMDTDDLETISSDWHQEMMWEELEDTGTKIDRPFWLVAESNGCENFIFFYLDEETEDPEVYFYVYGTKDRREIKAYGKKFSQFVDDLVDDAYKILKTGL